jgi:hypothetical protein
MKSSKPKPRKFWTSFVFSGLTQRHIAQQDLKVDQVLVAAERAVPEKVGVLLALQVDCDDQQ